MVYLIFFISDPKMEAKASPKVEKAEPAKVATPPPQQQQQSKGKQKKSKKKKGGRR